MKLEKWKNKWKEWSNLRKWQIWKLKLIDARLYFVSIFVGLLTGLVAVPYHYLLWYFFDVRKTFFTAHYPWYWHVLLFFILWGILIFVASLVKRMPLIAGGGIPQTRAANNGRIRYEHPFKELVAKFCGGVLALSAGLSLGREGPSVQIGSYIGTLISRWGHILKGERKQLLAAGAGAGLSAAFAAPLSSSLLVIESIERFDAPKTAITTLLAGVVAGGVASWMFPTTPYHLISAVVPGLSFIRQAELYIIFAALMAVIAKFYSLIVPFFQERIPAMKLSIPVKMLYLLIIAYAISLTETNLTGGGEQFLMMQGMNGTHDIRWLTIMMLIHFVFTLFSLSSGLPGGSFIPTLVTGGLLGQIFGLVLVQRGWIGYENVSYMMLIGMVAFLVAVVRTPLTAIVLITEITGHFEVFYPSIVVGGLTYYFTELLQIKPYNVLLYDRMFRSISARFLYLFQTFPTAGSKRSSDNRESMFVGITCGFLQSHLETTQATASSFRLLLHSCHSTTPGIMIIIGIYNFQSQGLGIPRTFVLADNVFLQRINIGITIIDNRSDTMLHQALYDG